jgi:hypothetical protein
MARVGKTRKENSGHGGLKLLQAIVRGWAGDSPSRRKGRRAAKKSKTGRRSYGQLSRRDFKPN